MSKARVIKKMGKVVSEDILGALAGTTRRRRLSRKFLGRAEAALRRYHRDDTERNLREVAKKLRPHANYFKWTNKETEEVGVVTTLLAGLPAGHRLEALRDVRPGKPDPPDVIGTRQDDAFVALEVTELVDEEVTGRNVRAAKATVGLAPLERMRQTVQRVWDKTDLLEAVGDLLKEKDGKKLHGGPFAEYVVVIHTDEYMLDHDEAEHWLQGHTFAGMLQVTDAYLLFSYVPAIGGCPSIRLSVAGT